MKWPESSDSLEITFIFASGLWSKGIRCESGTVPAAVNLETRLHDAIAAIGCEKAQESGDESEDLP